MLKALAALSSFSLAFSAGLSFASDPPNLALNKPVQASSVEEGVAAAPESVVDGDVTTRWASLWEDPQWIVVDLEDVETISCVVLEWEAAYAKGYQLQLSEDAKSWKTVFHEESGDGDVDRLVFDAERARFVRLLGQERGTPYGYSLFELAVYAELKKLEFDDEPVVSLTLFDTVPHALTAPESGGTFGLSFVDFDNDGDLDIFCVNPSHDEHLFLNQEGSFTFADPKQLGIEVAGLSSGVSWGDYDNDGDLDLAVAVQGGLNGLFANFVKEGKAQFVGLTEGSPVTDEGNSFDGAFLDYDNDGLLDLVVSNVGVMGPGEGAHTAVYHNTGSGVLVPELDNAIAKDLSNNTSTSWSDVDNDGDLDCYVPDFGLSDKLYRNQGNGVFTLDDKSPIGGQAGVSISGVFADYDNDRDMDLFIATGYPAPEADRLFENDGKGTFRRISEGPIVKRRTPSWNASWGDMDNDGDLDIYLTTLPGRNYLYQNNNDGSFTRVVDDVTVSEAYPSCAAVWGDVDDDGDLDLAVNDLEAGVVNLYRNRGNGNHWLEVSCEGVISNRSGLGARVEVRADINGVPVWQAREVSSSNGFRQRSQGRRVHFGLGDAETVDELVIRWPSGQTEVHSGVEVNQRLRVREPVAEQDRPAE